MVFYLHATHGKERYKGIFCPLLQLQFPNDESREERKDKIRNNGSDAIHDCQVNSDIEVNAFAWLILHPSIGYGLALEYRDEEEEKPRDCRAEHGYVDDPFV